MRRRDVLGSAVAAAALAPFGAAAQPGLPIVGYLSSRSAEAETGRTGFLEGVGRGGDRRRPGCRDQVPFRRRTPRSSAVFRCRVGATSGRRCWSRPGRLGVGGKEGDIDNPDRVRERPRTRFGSALSQALAGPGGNATGFTAFSTEVGAKRLELLREVLPQPGLIAFLVDPKAPGASPQIPRWKAPPRRSDNPF